MLPSLLGPMEDLAADSSERAHHLSYTSPREMVIKPIKLRSGSTESEVIYCRVAAARDVYLVKRASLCATSQLKI